MTYLIEGIQIFNWKMHIIYIYKCMYGGRERERERERGREIERERGREREREKRFQGKNISCLTACFFLFFLLFNALLLTQRGVEIILGLSG